jgi:hypothetical protein
MKKISTIIITASLGALLAGCGDSGDSKAEGKASAAKSAPAKSGGKTLRDIGEDNWQKMIKDTFGLDIVLPEGWSFKSVKSLNGVNNADLVLFIGEDAATTGPAFAKLLFDATQSTSPHGNYKAKINPDLETVSADNAIEEFKSVHGNENDHYVTAAWNYTFEKRMVMFNFFAPGDKATGKQAQLSFTLN